MGRTVCAGIIGDEHPTVQGYSVIRSALQHAGRALNVEVDARWLPSHSLEGDAEHDLRDCDALWCGPWGPYRNSDAAITAIRYARERGIPFLGTCAGFQHAVIEYARSVLGLAAADHAESNPESTLPVVSPLSNPLVNRVGAVVLDPASRTASIYRRTEVAERYRCAFGLNPDYLTALHRGGLRVSGVSEEGLAMAVEFADHPFFFATLFMPEHRSRASAPHPLISAYLQAAARRLQ